MANFYLQYPASSGGTSTNASVGVTGTTAPTSATEVGFINGSGNLTPVSPSTPLPVTGTVTATNPSVGTNGAAAPTSSTEVGGINPSGNLNPLHTDTLNNLLVLVNNTNPIVTDVLTIPPPLDNTQTGSSSLGSPAIFAYNGISSGVLEITTISGGTISLTIKAQVNNALIQLPVAGSNDLWTLAPMTALGSYRIEGLAGFQQINVVNTGTGTAGLAINMSEASGPTEVMQLNAANLNVTVAGSTLPTGAATAALQSDVQSAPGTPQTTAITVQGNASGVPIPISGTITASNPSVGLTGSATPTSATEIGGTDGTNLRALSVNASGQLNVNNISGTVSLPTGASTSALQTTGNTSLSTIVTNTTGLATAANQTTLGNQTTKINDGTNTATIKPASTAPLATDTALVVAVSPNNTVTTTIADPILGNKASVNFFGQIGVVSDGTALFNESFEGTVIDTVNRWNSPVLAGTGTITQSGVQALVITVGTTANNAAALSSQPTFPTQYSSPLTWAAGIKLEATIATGNYRFWGLGTQGTTYSTSDPITNGIGFEVTTAGVLRAVIYASDAVVFSQNLTIPTDGLEHVYVIILRGNFVQWYVDNTTIPVALNTTLGIAPDLSILPIRYASLNGASTTTGTPLMSVFGQSIIDGARNNIEISDGTFPWRKAIVTAAGALTVTGAVTSTSTTTGPVTPGTAAANSNLAGMVFNTAVQTPTNGQQLALQSDAFGNLITSHPDMIVTGAAAQTAIVNNILTTASGAAATDAKGYKSVSVQVVSTGTAGTFIFEGSNDNVNFQTIPVFNQLILTGTPITAAITATASQLVYSFPTTTEFIRLRIVTTITGGSIQAFSKFMQMPYSPAITQVAQTTAANLAVNATIAAGTITTVSSVTSSQTAIPGIIVDVASAALTTTTTTATLTPTFGSSYMVDIPVTVVSGTTPTLSVQVQESPDTGTNWFTVYTFPTITAVGSYTSPVLTLQGNRVRYIQTVTGTTPSFTRAINRLQSSQSNYQKPTGSIFADRSGTTSATPSTSTLLAAANNNRRYFIVQNLGTTAPIYINFTAAADTTTSLQLAPLASYVMESNTITTEAINVLSTSASISYSAKEG